MNKEQRKKVLNSLKDSSQGKALKDFLDEKIEEVRNVENCENWEEAQGKKIAVNILKKVFSFLENEEKQERTKNQYE